jgi:8-oxo-dGTP pyrophosphatase MutT (NUDIX family)
MIVPLRNTVVFEAAPWFRVEAVEVPNSSAPYYRVAEAPGVICIVLSAQGDFVMVRQDRPVVGASTLEFPAGRIDKGETPDIAVRREVFEETGMRLAHVGLIGTSQPMPNRYDAHQSMFIGVCADEPAKPAIEGHMEIVPRERLKSILRTELNYFPVALGAIKMAEVVWPIDVFNDPIDAICRHLPSINHQ